MPCNKECCSCEKNTHRTDEEKKKLINRLNRIEGQVRGIRGMIEKDAYCADVRCQRYKKRRRGSYRRVNEAYFKAYEIERLM